MSSIRYWAEAAEPVLAFAAEGARVPTGAAVRFLRHLRGEAAGNTLYIGEAEEIRRRLEQGGGLEGALLFASGTAEGLEELAKKRGAALVCSALDILDIHERLSETAESYRSWEEKIGAAEQSGNIGEVVRAASETAGMPLIILNSGGRVIYSHGSGGGKMCAELLATGSLSEENAKTLAGAPEGDCAFLKLEDGGCWVCGVLKNERLISNMLLFAPAGRENFDAESLMDMIREAISRIVQARGDTEYWAGAEFRALLDDMVESRVSAEDEINRRIALISRVPKRFCTFVIIDFQAGEEWNKAPEHFFTRLEELFPDSNMTEYKSSVVVLLSRPDRAFQPMPIFDYEAFNALLTESGAFAGISNATSRRSMLRTNYLLTKAVLQRGKALRGKPSQRIFYFEDYVEYLMIDLCINSFSELLGHDDIIYLTHPEVVKLARYDKKNETNLLDVLYAYCISNGSIAGTAKLAYMHRNTAAAKIAKIKELIQADLGDGQVQQRMIFSCKILKYYDKYAKINTDERLYIAEPEKAQGAPK